MRVTLDTNIVTERNTGEPTMVVGIAKASKGIITLPEELRDALGDPQEYLVIEQADGLYLKRIERPRQGGLLEIAEKLSALDDNEPMTMEEIQAEVDAVRAERRAKRENRS
jgi:bifunctional DNA-binding transcriptional regulator/antitoxin component of YhaV-PrlF toxin-antitoxin module